MHQTHGDVIQGLRFLDERPWYFMWFTIQRLQPLNLARHELLYREGDLANAVYFLFQGAI